MQSEKDRWEMKLERLQNRTETVWEKVAKLKPSSKDKVELYGSFCSFISGLCAHLEDEHPELKGKA
jgi:hypothetical protein